jgi:K+-sensing histidine kinase KdpD
MSVVEGRDEGHAKRKPHHEHPNFARRKVCRAIRVGSRTGIPEDKLKEVFEPFYTSKAEGMGMGLSIARTIIEAHHGLIWAKKRDHCGASFRIRLPLVR